MHLIKIWAKPHTAIITANLGSKTWIKSKILVVSNMLKIALLMSQPISFTMSKLIAIILVKSKLSRTF